MIRKGKSDLASPTLFEGVILFTFLFCFLFFCAVHIMGFSIMTKVTENVKAFIYVSLCYSMPIPTYVTCCAHIFNFYKRAIY